MKPEEAIKILQERIGLTKKVWSNVPEIIKYREALELAVKALEKQMRRKVRYEVVEYDECYDVNLYACICPSCGLHIIEFSDNDVVFKCNSDSPEDVFHSSMVHHAYIGMNNYCNRCGQKLDWSEKDGVQH